MLSLCQFDGHDLLFPGSTSVMLGFQASYSQGCCDFVLLFFHLTDDPGNAFDAKQKRMA